MLRARKWAGLKGQSIRSGWREHGLHAAPSHSGSRSLGQFFSTFVVHIFSSLQRDLLYKHFSLLFNPQIILTSIFWNTSCENTGLYGVECSEIRNFPYFVLSSLHCFTCFTSPPHPPLPFFPLFLFHFSLDPSLSLLPTLLSLCA